jgi:hypothetical protein
MYDYSSCYINSQTNLEIKIMDNEWNVVIGEKIAFLKNFQQGEEAENLVFHYPLNKSKRREHDCLG